MSLRVKLLISILLVTLVAWGIAAFSSYQATRVEVEHIFDAHLIESAKALLKQAAHERREMEMRGDESYDDHWGDDEDQHSDDKDDEDDEKRSSHGLKKLKEQKSSFEKRLMFEIWDGDGRLLLRSGSELKDLHLPDGFSYASQGALPLRVLTQWNAKRSLKIVVAESVTARQALANASVRNVLRSMLWMILPLIILLALTIEMALRPIRQLSADVGKRSAEDLTPINGKPVPKEFRAMIRALNTLFGKLAKAIENERRFTADAAHELRTPLAAIKVQAQVAIREKNDEARKKALEATVSGVDRATHLVEQLLTLARLDPETSRPIEVVSLHEVATQVLQNVAPVAVAKAIEIELLGREPSPVRGQRAMLEILFRNLIDNAIRYTPGGGKVTVSLEATSAGVRLAIEDSGVGLSEAQMQVVGERFSRLSRPSGEGSGLGLSIVQRIAAIHQATLKLENRAAGQGLVVTVSFPKV